MGTKVRRAIIKTHTLLFLVGLLLIQSTSNGQSINPSWEQDLNTSLKEFQSCRNTNTVVQGISPCNKFLGQSLKTVYKIDDFYSKEMGRYMLVSEIADFLDKSDKWTLLGHAYEQNILNEAQSLANSKNAVVAIYLNSDDIGHISVILPGEIKPSGSWGFQVPNSVSFFSSEPENSYVNKGLSYAFGRNIIMKVLIYKRNY